MEFKLIAEIGANHLGSMRFAKEMIDSGIKVGIKYFKFQIYKMDEICESSDWAWYNYMDYCALTESKVHELNDYCQDRNVVFFASVFGEWSLNVAKSIDMPIYKIASRSLYSPTGEISDFAKTIYALNRETISSLGFKKEGWSVPDIKHNSNLYCISKYPTTRDDIVWPEFGGEISGFSDHTIGTEASKESIDLGATIIEKHYTLDKTLYGPDQSGSATPNEMKEIIDHANRRIGQ